VKQVFAFYYQRSMAFIYTQIETSVLLRLGKC